MSERMVYLFPGQGSQYAAMARDIVRFPRGQELLDLAQAETELPLVDLLYRGSATEVNHPQVAQLGVLVYSLAALDLLGSRGLAPDLVAGHSLGEYSALVAAGVVDEREAIALVARRGSLMAESASDRPGAMAAIAGLDREAIEELCTHAPQPTVIANLNSQRQSVVSGVAEGVDDVVAAAQRAGALRARRLPVGGAYHSPLMSTAAEGMRAVLATTTPRDPRITLVAGSTGAVLRTGLEVWHLLGDQIANPVRWSQAMRTIARLDPRTCYEVGPGRVLAGLAREGLHGLRVRAVNSRELNGGQAPEPVAPGVVR